jgi:small subunit ribosomal protein S6
VNKYELTVVVRPAAAEGMVVKLREILQKFGVEITAEDPWGVKKLAYEIDGEKSGYYYFARVNAPADSIDKIIAEFRLITDIMRYLFVKEQKNQPAAPVKPAVEAAV